MCKGWGWSGHGSGVRSDGATGPHTHSRTRTRTPGMVHEEERENRREAVMDAPYVIIATRGVSSGKPGYNSNSMDNSLIIATRIIIRDNPRSVQARWISPPAKLICCTRGHPCCTRNPCCMDIYLRAPFESAPCFEASVAAGAKAVENVSLSGHRTALHGSERAGRSRGGAGCHDRGARPHTPHPRSAWPHPTRPPSAPPSPSSPPAYATYALPTVAPRG